MTIIKTYVDSSKGVVSYLQDPLNESVFEVDGVVSASSYLGMNYSDITVGTATTGSTTNIAGYNATRIIHETTIGGGRGSNSPGQGPTISTSGALLLFSFTPNDANDRLYRMFKIPTAYVSEPTFHVHWTKSSNADETGKNVRWRMGYSVYNGISEDAAATVTTVEIEDTYEGSGTTNRIIYRASDINLSNFVAGYYMSVYIESMSPISGSAMASEPALISLDLRYRAYINQ